MKIKGFVEEDFVNFYLPSMVLMTPYCSWKCGAHLCHNSPLDKAPIIELTPVQILSRYYENPLTKALVFSGLEPFDSFADMYEMIGLFREELDDPIVIYTGYDEEEIEGEIDLLREFSNIYVKFGRFIEGHQPHFDPVLKVKLASDNQYGEKIS